MWLSKWDAYLPRRDPSHTTHIERPRSHRCDGSPVQLQAYIGQRQQQAERPLRMNETRHDLDAVEWNERSLSSSLITEVLGNVASDQYNRLI